MYSNATKRPQHHDLNDSTGPERYSTYDGCSLSRLKVMDSQTKSEEMEMKSESYGRCSCISTSRRRCRAQPTCSPSTALLKSAILEREDSLALVQKCVRHKNRKFRYMHTLSTSHLPVLSPRLLLLACSSFIILLSSIRNVGASTIETDDADRKFLRSSGKENKNNSQHRRLSSPYDEPEQDEDYEALHARLNIPLPAMGASLMGVMHDSNDEDVPQIGRVFAFAGTNAALQELADLEVGESKEKQTPPSNDKKRRKLSSNEDNDAKSDRIFSFAGTNQAMKNLEAQQNDQSLPTRANARRDTLLLGSQNYGTTVSQIAKSRSSLLWGSDEYEYEEDETEDELDLSTLGSSLHALQSSRHISPMLERSNTDLDRGRYLVGLEVRDIQSHQQILVDYETNDGTTKPLRIKYALSQGAGETNANELLILEQLLDSSFSPAAEMWSRALRVNPVPNKIYPTVEACGAATVPALDRENGVEDADIVIYVSSDNRFCGGALMHSAVCDFDQHTRPLVGNINVCTKNLPHSDSPQGMASIQDFTLREYSSYLATESGRILGASTSLFSYYMDPQTMTRYGTTEKSITCLDGKEETLAVPNIIFEEVYKDGSRSHELRTPRVTEIVRNHFDCMVLTGARLEQGKDSIGCFGGFLDDHQFYSEEMTRFESISTKGPSISPLTLALLEDSSWYTANFKASNETSFGRGAGCQFARSGCLFDEAAPDLDTESSAFHCTEIGEMGCDASHMFKAKCDFLDSAVSSDAETTSFCPMHTRQAVSCTDSSAFLATGGEYYGASSRCFQTDRGEPMCLRGECNELTRALDVFYEGQMFSCQKDDQIIDTMKGMQIKCPNIAAVCPILSCPSNCSGRGVCDRDRDGKHSCICDDPFDQSPGCYGEYQTDEL